MFNSKKLCDVASEMLAEQVKIWKSWTKGKILIDEYWLCNQNRELQTDKPLNHSASLFSHMNHINGWGLTKISLRNICELQAAVTKHKCDGFDKSILAGKLGRSDQWQQSCKQHVTADLICQSRDDETTHKQSAKKKKEGGGAARARTIHFSSKYGLWE